MILITSAAYVNSEFQIEFGRLPPAFLPIGNIRLFEWQIRALRNRFPAEQIWLSVPASYDLPPKDQRYLNCNEISILRIDENLSLADSVACALTMLRDTGEGLRLLHGDTLLTDIPSMLDVIGIVETNDDYDWEVEKIENHSESVWCGYFAFSDVNFLKSKLRLSKGNFISAIKLYDYGLKMKRHNINTWYDFGHINTYIQSRTRLTTERAFNSLVIRDGCVRKTGKPFKKIIAEAAWYKGIPLDLRVFCPQLLDAGYDDERNPFYLLEYLPLPPLNDIFVHGKNPVFFWNKIFELCNDFLTRCHEQALDAKTKRAVELSAAKLAKEKTYERLFEFFRQTGFPDLDTPLSINGEYVSSLSVIVQKCLDKLDKTSPVFGISHGDFCLSNILFDSRSERIKVIDPRGLDAQGQCSVYGDLRYDLAKLTHSIVGLYDHIISGAFQVRSEKDMGEHKFYLEIDVEERVKLTQEIFLNKTYINSLEPVDVMPLTILLFLSMLPLHVDNPQRQIALFANALRLYAKFIYNGELQ